MIGHSEGSTCNRDGCQGSMEFTGDEDSSCHCHLIAPCSFCVDQPLICDHCGEEAEYEHMDSPSIREIEEYNELKRWEVSHCDPSSGVVYSRRGTYGGVENSSR